MNLKLTLIKTNIYIPFYDSKTGVFILKDYPPSLPRALVGDFQSCQAQGEKHPMHISFTLFYTFYPKTSIFPN